MEGVTRFRQGRCARSRLEADINSSAAGKWDDSKWHDKAKWYIACSSHGVARGSDGNSDDDDDDDWVVVKVRSRKRNNHKEDEKEEQEEEKKEVSLRGSVAF